MDAPSPELSPREVVARVVEAGRLSADRAASALWAHGGARLRASAGSPEHLARLLTNDLFRPLVSYLRARFAEPALLADSARQLVTLEGPDGSETSFLFAVARAKQGERAGCWLVSGVERVEADYSTIGARTRTGSSMT